MEVCDFSVRGRAKYLMEKANANLGGVRYLASTGAKAYFPWDSEKVSGMDGDRNGVVFFHVS